jgi:hypothetical protein
MEIFTTFIAVFGIIAVLAVTAINVMSGAARRRLLHKERMSAIDKGVPLPEDVDAELEAERKRMMNGRDASLQGTILTALGLGMLAASKLVPRSDFGGDAQRFLAFLELWAYPITFVGIGLLLYALFTRNRRKS